MKTWSCFPHRVTQVSGREGAPFTHRGAQGGYSETEGREGVRYTRRASQGRYSETSGPTGSVVSHGDLYS